MQKKDKKYILSASDINGYLNCKHLTQLDTKVANGELNRPEFKNPHAKIMQERGFEHENSYVDYLVKQGKSFDSANASEDEDGFENTKRLMKEGIDIITQGVLRIDGWFGRSDILLKVENSKSDLGDYSYEVMDTKLSRETKAGSIMQLCLYSEMLKEIQGVSPEFMYVVTPGDHAGEFNEEKYRVNDYEAYYRLVRDKLINALGSIEAYPEPVAHCDVCAWWESCNKRRRDDDHLSLVANITKNQRKDLESLGVTTMEAFSEVDPERFKELPFGTNLKSLELSREQARVQVQARKSGDLIHELLEIEEGRGLSRLPEPSLGDLFFDIEGDTFVGRHGLEYLFGLTYLEGKEQKYKGFWATAPLKERVAFKELMEFVLERAKTYPDMHIYHYAPYETGAVKRLAQRYSLYEEELDNLLRAGKFIDLYGVVKQSIRCSVEKYSIKDLEAFSGYKRKIALDEMIVHKRALEHNLELNRFEDITDEMKSAVMLYNQDDTDSTLALRDWLEKLRQEAIDKGEQILRPEVSDGVPEEELNERDQKLLDIKNELTKDINYEDELSDKDKVKILLGDLAAFYRREEKVAFWELFRLKEMNQAELREDKSGLSDLELVERIPPKGKGKIYSEVYRYPDQDVDFRTGDDIHICGGDKVASLVEHNPYERTITVKKTGKTNDLTLDSVYRFSIVRAEVMEKSSIDMCEDFIKNTLDGTKYQAIRDILLRKLPNTDVEIQAPKGEDILEHTYKVVEGLNNSYLPIQGPPGAGKSYTGSHLIEYLLGKGYKVGVSAISHKVISGLLTSTQKLVGDSYPIVHKTSDKDQVYKTTTKNEDCENLAHGDTPCVIGGTSWLFAREGMEGTLDYLFIDEGGQLSLANLLSISRATKNLIILGDCQQLEQPIQAAHPEGADLSALEYIQGDHSTIPEDRGVFLGKTFRLNPEICKFNSELFYESRLESAAGNEVNIISGPSDLKPLMHLNVEHYGNTSVSVEEVEFIKTFITGLLENKHDYTYFDHKEKKAQTHRLNTEDIMVIAPYNAQVQRLKDALPDGVEIGTVDKFQGREAPIVIYSVTTSSAEDAPRGMDFLYSASRLNVAVSRAQCSFVMVSNKAVFEPNCKSPAQMKLANAYCRYFEMVKKG